MEFRLPVFECTRSTDNSDVVQRTSTSIYLSISATHSSPPRAVKALHNSTADRADNSSGAMSDDPSELEATSKQTGKQTVDPIKSFLSGGFGGIVSRPSIALSHTFFAHSQAE